MARASSIGAQVWSLIAVGVGLNLLLGALVALFKIPLYFDSLGTVLVASLAGPWAGAITGVCGVVLLGLTSPTALAFFPVAALVGLASGGWAKLGSFRKPWSSALAGALTGMVGAAAAAPIATYLYGGVTGGGTDLLVALFRAQGAGALLASFWQGLAVDPLDKAVTFVSVAFLLRSLPARALRCYPLGHHIPHKPAAVAYRPQPNSAVRRSEAAPSAHSAEAAVDDLPPAEAELKLITLAITLSVAALWPLERYREALLLLALSLAAHLLVAPRLCLRLLRQLALMLLPLALSLTLISGLLARRESDLRVLWLGLSWSVPGVTEAVFFLTRAGLMLWGVSLFFSTTPLARLGEILFRLRVPYTIIYVVLTGADLARQLRHRWNSVEQAQQCRGLSPGGGLRRRFQVFLAVLAPTLGSVFSELPIRASALQSRGLMRAHPRARLPNAWLQEAEPTLGGRLFQVGISLSLLAGYLWL